MAETQAIPLPGVIPHLTIRDRRGTEAIDFYVRVFGAQESGRHFADDGVRLMHAHLQINGGSLMLNDDFPEYSGEESAPPASVTLHLQVDDADRWWARATEAGAQVRMPLDNQFWGDRYGQLVDPFGHVWSIGGPLKE